MDAAVPGGGDVGFRSAKMSVARRSVTPGDPTEGEEAMARTSDNAEHEANQMLFQVVHEVATGLAGRPAPSVFAALRGRVPRAPGLDDGELMRIAQEISIGRDPSGL
jgi:hypothetical protein